MSYSTYCFLGEQRKKRSLAQPRHASESSAVRSLVCLALSPSLVARHQHTLCRPAGVIPPFLGCRFCTGAHELILPCRTRNEEILQRRSDLEQKHQFGCIAPASARFLDRKRQISPKSKPRILTDRPTDARLPPSTEHRRGVRGGDLQHRSCHQYVWDCVLPGNLIPRPRKA